MKHEKKVHKYIAGIFFVVALSYSGHSYGAVAPDPTTLRLYMVQHYQDILDQQTLKTDGMIRDISGFRHYFNGKAEWWKSWQPSSRFLRYVLDFDCNNELHIKELRFCVFKYVMAGLSVWSIITMIRHYCKNRQKHDEIEQIVRTLKKIEAENAVEDAIMDEKVPSRSLLRSRRSSLYAS